MREMNVKQLSMDYKRRMCKLKKEKNLTQGSYPKSQGLNVSISV